MARRSFPFWRSDRKQWYGRINGQQVRLKVYDENDRDAADLAFAKLVAAVADGVADRLKVAPVPIAGDQTVTAAAAAYLAAAQKRLAAEKIEPGSVANTKKHLAHIAKEFGPRTLASLTADELLEWADRPSWSSSYQNAVLGTVQSLLRVARVVLVVKRPPAKSRGADVVLDDDQFARVLRQLNSSRRKKGDLCQLLQALRETGARPQEMARLTVEDVDWDNSLVRLIKHKTAKKTGSVRIVHLSSTTLSLLSLQRHKYSSGLLFRNSRGRAHTQANLVQRLIKCSRLVGFRVIAYGQRHSFATKALSKGIPDVVVAGLLGHTTPAMVNKHYSHINANARVLKAALELMAKPTASE